MKEERPKNKPRVGFCWECGARLYGNNFKIIKVDGYDRVVHKQCSNPNRELQDQDLEDL